MKAFYRVVTFLLIVGVVLGGIYLIFSFFAAKNKDQAKILTITRDGKFSTNKIKIGNSDKFKIKNSDDINQTVKISGTDKTLAEIDSNSTSKEVVLEKDKKSVFYLASDSNQKVEIEVGTIKQTTNTKQTVPTVVLKSPSGAVKAETTTEPLPNTGPGDSFLLPLSTVVGFLFLKISNLFWKKFIG